MRACVCVRALVRGCVSYKHGLQFINLSHLATAAAAAARADAAAVASVVGVAAFASVHEKPVSFNAFWFTSRSRNSSQHQQQH